MGNYIYSESLEDEPKMDIKKEENVNLKKFEDIYESIEDVQRGLIKSGLESSNLIIGIDYTCSNENKGEKTFFDLNLHTIKENLINPYQHVISIIGRTLSKLDEDNM